MRFYMAPMEGLTGYIYRNAYHAYFQGIDKYYSPFIVANQSDSLKSRELNDILPENNCGMFLVPQILANHAAYFLQTAEKIRQLGYSEVNLNLGCPSGTVVAKHKGSGFLAKKEELDAFLEEIYSKTQIKISVKTRIGKEQPDEFYELIEIFNKYPMEELIIHPRIQKDFYNNKPNLEIFEHALKVSKNPICYNGDIHTVGDYIKFTEAYPTVDAVMLGRGLMMNPALILAITGQGKLDKGVLKEFHDRIYEGYKQVMSGDRNVLFRMKELWFYLGSMFLNNEKHLKKIKKSERFHDYEEAVVKLFQELDLRDA